MPYQNLLCLRRICLFVYVCSVTSERKWLCTILTCASMVWFLSCCVWRYGQLVWLGDRILSTKVKNPLILVSIDVWRQLFKNQQIEHILVLLFLTKIIQILTFSCSNYFSIYNMKMKIFQNLSSSITHSIHPFKEMEY